MMNEQLHSELASADPVPGSDDAELRALVRRMSAEAREASIAASAARAPWWKRRRVMIPLAVGVVVALTGSAVLVPLDLWSDGVKVDLDAEIPIVYTTDTGVDVTCRFGIHFGDPTHRTAADEALAEFVETHDWTGIGQRIYDEAILNPFVPGPDDDLEVDTQEGRDAFSFYRALDLISEEIPIELRQAGQSSGATTDCTGQLR